MQVKGNHPLAEIIAKKLFGIENVHWIEASRMVSNAAKAAVEWHEKEMERETNPFASCEDVGHLWREYKDTIAGESGLTCLKCGKDKILRVGD